MSDTTKEKKGSGEQLDWNPYTYAFFPTLCGISFFLCMFGIVESVSTYDLMWKVSIVYFVIDLVVQLMAMDFT